MSNSIKFNQLSINGWLLSIFVVGSLILPALFMDGMFLDATLYSAVAHNLSQGIGSFWFPIFGTKIANLETFHEQPPLGIWLISLSFKVFGNSIFAERLFVLLILLGNIYLIHHLWLLIYHDSPSHQNFSWLPVIYWGIIPLTFWSFSNNMLENIVSMFTLISAYSFLKSYNHNSFLLWTLIAGFAIIAGFMTKGFPALFPIITPLAFYVIFRKSTTISLNKILYQYSIVFTIILLFGIFIYLHPDAQKSMKYYLIHRAFFRINQQPTTDSHFYTLYRLFMELLPPIILSTIFILLSHIKFSIPIVPNLKKYQKLIVFFLILGLAGSLPLMLTRVQKGFYMVPSFSFFAIAFGILSSEFVIPLWSCINTTFSKSVKPFLISLNVLLVIITISLAGTPKRERKLLSDVQKLSKIIPPYEIVSIENYRYQTEWPFICYLGRIGQISVDGPNCSRKYFIKFKSDTSFSCKNFQKLPYHFNLIEVFKNNQMK